MITAGAASLRRHWLEAAAALAFLVFSVALQPPVLASAPARMETAAISSAIALLAVLAYIFLSARFLQRRYWIPLVVICGLMLVALGGTLRQYAAARQTYSVTFEGVDVVVGTDADLTELGKVHRQASPSDTPADVLASTAGKPQIAWEESALREHASRFQRLYFLSQLLAALAAVTLIGAWRARSLERLTTEANVPEMARSVPTPGKRFLVALSFPGEVRHRVDGIANEVASRIGRERVFYDLWHRAELARPDMDLHLQNIYKSQAELLVIVLCADYQRKEWCGLEWRVVRDMIKSKETSRIMFLRLDDAPIEGLLSIDGYLDITQMPDVEVAAAIVSRVQAN